MKEAALGRSLINFYHGQALLVRAQRSVTKVITRWAGGMLRAHACLIVPSSAAAAARLRARNPFVRIATETLISRFETFQAADKLPDTRFVERPWAASSRSAARSTACLASGRSIAGITVMVFNIPASS